MSKKNEEYREMVEKTKEILDTVTKNAEVNITDIINVLSESLDIIQEEIDKLK